MRSITFEKNYNKKLTCDAFLHIGLPPVTGMVPEHVLEEPVEISVTTDPSLKVTAVVTDILRLDLTQLQGVHTIPSHAMDAKFFRAWWLEKHPSAFSVAVYYYRRLS